MRFQAAMDFLWHSLVDPLSFAFMQRSLLVAVAVGILCAVVGSYLLVQNLALLGDAISHSLLPGLALAYLLGWNLLVGAFVAGILSALLIQWIRSASPIKADAAMGIVFSAFFALGIVLITLIQRRARIDLNHFLFGNLLGVSQTDVITVVAITLGVLAVVVLFFKELAFYSFDPLAAKAAGLPTEQLGWGVMVLTSLTLVASMKAVGVLLVLAMLITPAATAYLLVPQLHQVMLLGSLFGVSASFIGLYISYYLNIASGPAIVLVASLWFGLAFVGKLLRRPQ